MTTFPRVLIEVTVAAPADEVWRSLRDKERIAQWFGWDADSLDAEIEHIFFKYGRGDDAQRALVFEGMSDRIEVEPLGERSCVVRIIRAAPTPDHDWEDIFEDVTQGWIAFLQQLRFTHERHPRDRRRTLFLSGSPHRPDEPLAARAFGLPATGAPGTEYAITASTGDALAGRIWHRGRHQLAVTVDGVGDGLLLAMGPRARREAAPRSQPGHPDDLRLQRHRVRRARGTLAHLVERALRQQAARMRVTSR